MVEAKAGKATARVETECTGNGTGHCDCYYRGAPCCLCLQEPPELFAKHLNAGKRFKVKMVELEELQ